LLKQYCIYEIFGQTITQTTVVFRNFRVLLLCLNYHDFLLTVQKHSQVTGLKLCVFRHKECSGNFLSVQQEFSIKWWSRLWHAEITFQYSFQYCAPRCYA